MATSHQDPPPYDLFSQAFLADPFPTLRKMRVEHPVYWHPLANCWILTRHDDIQTLARDRRFSADRVEQFSHSAPPHLREKQVFYNRFLSLWMVFVDPPRHTVLRSLVSKAFTAKTVEDLRPFTEKLVDEVLDSVIDSGKMDIIKDLAAPVPAAVIGKMLGVPNKDIGQFKTWTDELFNSIGSMFATEEVVEAAYRGTVGLLGYFRDLIAERRKAPGADLLSQLIMVEEQGEVLSEEELVAMCGLLLSAGHETTTHIISNAVLSLLNNPAELEKLRAHPSFLEGALEELARYDAAVSLLGRRAAESVELRGQQIQAGQLVLGMLNAAGRDPEHYPDPDRLDVTRKDVRSLGFGHGIHYCVGAPLARMEARIVLHKLLERMHHIRLASQSLEWIPSLLIHGVVSLPVTFEARGQERAVRPPSLPPPSIPPPSLRDLELPQSRRAPPSVPPPSRGFPSSLRR